MKRMTVRAVFVALLLSLVPAVAAQANTTATTTVLEAPNQFGVNSAMPLRIQVTNTSGAAAPTGTVTLQDSQARTLITVPLTPTTNGGFSWAIINWWSQQLGFNQLRAVYNPGASGFAASQSTYAGIFILESTPLAVLRMPDRFVVGTPANLTTLVNPGNGGGSAVLQVNNQQVANSTPINAAGQVPFVWTPTSSTNYTFVIDYSNAGGTDGRQIRQSMFAFPR